MSNRKEEILETAIVLFNEKGCINTSTRHIADELGISVGNLYYYYKNKEDIIVAIYTQFMDLLSIHINSVKDGVDAPFDFYNFLNDQLELERKYRFLRLETNFIYLNYPKLAKELEKGLVKKYKEFQLLYSHQIKYKYMKELDEMQMKFVCSNTWIVGAQWELYWIIMKYEDEKLRRVHGVLNLLYFIKPYLTKKGLEESNLLDSIEYLKKQINDVK